MYEEENQLTAVTPEQRDAYFASQGQGGPSEPVPSSDAPAPGPAPAQGGALTIPGDTTGVLSAFGERANATEARAAQLESAFNAASEQARRELLGKQALAFAKENNLPLTDKRVVEMAGKGTINPVEKGLSFLSGIIGLPLGILGKAMGENIDVTAPFKPEQTAMKNAREAIASLDMERATALSKLEDIRTRNRIGMLDALGPTLKDLNKANQPMKFGTAQERMRAQFAQEIFGVEDNDPRIPDLMYRPEVDRRILTWATEYSKATVSGGQVARNENPTPRAPSTAAPKYEYKVEGGKVFRRRVN